MGNINKEKFILDAIKKNPGINRTKLCILLELEGCSSIGINKILETLKKHNIIYGKKDGRNIFYYDKERFLKDNPNFVETLEIKNEQELKQKKQEVLKQKKQEVLKQKKKEEFERLSKLEYNKNYMPTKQEKDIIKEIMINPNLSAKELAISLKMTQDNLSRKIAILRNNNIIYEIKVGVYVFY